MLGTAVQVRDMRRMSTWRVLLEAGVRPWRPGRWAGGGARADAGWLLPGQRAVSLGLVEVEARGRCSCRLPAAGCGPGARWCSGDDLSVPSRRWRSPPVPAPRRGLFRPGETAGGWRRYMFFFRHAAGGNVSGLRHRAPQCGPGPPLRRRKEGTTTSAAVYARVLQRRQARMTIGCQLAALREHAAASQLDVRRSGSSPTRGTPGRHSSGRGLEALRDLAAQGRRNGWARSTRRTGWPGVRRPGAADRGAAAAGRGSSP